VSGTAAQGPRLRPTLDGIPTYKPGKPAGADAYKLSSNENPYPPLPGVLEAATAAAGSFNRYPDMAVTGLTEELAARFGVPAEHIATGTGSVGVAQSLVLATAGPGEEVIFAWRSFEAYPIITQVAGATPVPVPLTDGRTVLPLASSQDHKRVGDGDTGLNTGGMGAYSPAPVLTAALQDEVMEAIMHPIVEGLAAEGIVYRGVLYAGLMIADGKPKVLEFNVRFGDPECQVLMMRLRSDLIDLVEATLDGTLVGCRPEWDARPAVGVVVAAEGYPGDPAKGDVITGVTGRPRSTESAVFHAGTARRGDDVVTSGGRVLTACALGADLRGAVANAYAAAATVSFRGMHYRKDIAHRALGR